MNLLTPTVSHRILVVDDNPSIHEDFRKILGGASSRRAELEAAEAALFGPAVRAATPADAPVYELDSAHQGQEGYEMVRRAVVDGRPYALAFVDIRMPPGWDGVETIGHLWEVAPDLQVVVCTAYSDYSWDEMRARLGSSDGLLILKKPFDNVEVLQLAHALTRKWNLARQAAATLDDLRAIVDDRTRELQAANAALQQSQERFAKAFGASPVAMTIQSMATQRYVDVNDAFLQLAGRDRADVLARTPHDLDLCEEPGAQAALLDLLRAEGRLRGIACRLRDHAGELRDVVVSGELLDVGGTAHALVVLEDVSDRLRLEARLRQAEKLEAVGQLAAGVAHDFNNMLTVILGHTSQRLAEGRLAPPVEESLRQIAAAASRAAGLTGQLLAFSRSQLLRLERVDVDALLGHLVAMLRPALGERIDVRYQTAERLPAILADAGGLEQVVTNLAVNARDAMPDGGQLTIGTARVDVDAGLAAERPEATAGSYLRISVADTGCGMDATTLRRVFEPFFTTKEVGRGTGMGLASAYGVVRQHGGWIEVESAVGRGSTFHVYLPLTEGGAPAASTAPGGSPTSGGGETILLVEDEDSVREVVQEILERSGYRLLLATDATQALDLWSREEGRVDLLLTDMVMPGPMTGRQLAARLREERKDLRVVYSSGYSVELAEDGGEPEPRSLVLPKPYKRDALTRTVRACLDL